ncbi:MAG: hypothetical protein ABSG63_00550 [Spirochaetia bacterium]|jgi:hypothetical protein
MGNKRMLTIVPAGQKVLAGLATFITLPAAAWHAPTEAAPVQFYPEQGLITGRGDWELGIVAYRNRPFLVDHLEHHVTTGELLYAVDDDFIMPVAPTKAGTELPDIEKMVAVHVRRGQGLLFGTAVWHWAPYPLRPQSFALVGFGRGTSTKDMIIRELDALVEMAFA